MKHPLGGPQAVFGGGDEFKSLRREASDLKEVLAKTLLENRLLKKSMVGGGEGRG